MDKLILSAASAALAVVAVDARSASAQVVIRSGYYPAPGYYSSPGYYGGYAPAYSRAYGSGYGGFLTPQLAGGPGYAMPGTVGGAYSTLSVPWGSGGNNTFSRYPTYGGYGPASGGGYRPAYGSGYGAYRPSGGGMPYGGWRR